MSVHSPELCIIERGTLSLHSSALNHFLAIWIDLLKRDDLEERIPCYSHFIITNIPQELYLIEIVSDNLCGMFYVNHLVELYIAQYKEALDSEFK